MKRAQKDTKHAPVPEPQAKDLQMPEAEQFWLELGPPSAYSGTPAYDTAVREGDASPRCRTPGLDRRRTGQRKPGRPAPRGPLTPRPQGEQKESEKSA